MAAGIQPRLRLDPVQQAAVLAPPGPVLVFAGAGSGKTRVLTHRIVHQIEQGLFTPDEIVAVTFTNKATEEMRERLGAMLGPDVARRLTISTLHSLANMLLGYGTRPRAHIYAEDDQRKMAHAVRRREQIRGRVDDLLMTISRQKSELRRHDQIPMAMDLLAETSPEAARMWDAYERELTRGNAMDFDDMLLFAVQMLEDDAALRGRVEQRYRSVLVDEYQDVNQVQYRLIQLLSAHGNLFAVGDDDQAIYGFRGADVRNILSFQHDHPTAQVFTLARNYRSVQPILDLAHQVVVPIASRAPKQLVAERRGGKKPVLTVGDDQDDEVLKAAARIQDVHDGGRAWKEITVLYRTHRQGERLEGALMAAGIPYRIVGQSVLSARSVRLVLSVLQLVRDRTHQIALRRLLGEPGFDVPVEEIDALLAAQPDPLRMGFPGSGAAGAAVRRLSGMLTRIESDLAQAGPTSPVAYLVRAVKDAPEMHEPLRRAAVDRETLDDEIAALALLAESLTDQPYPDALEALLDRAALASQRPRRGAEADEVLLMTIHTAKGLEFPAVILLGLNEGVLPLPEGRRESLDEERRLCYVAMTRAQDELHLFAAGGRPLTSFLRGVNVATRGPGVSIRSLPARLLAPRRSSKSTAARGARGGRRTPARPDRPSRARGR